jgi:hypothetical protein
MDELPKHPLHAPVFPGTATAGVISANRFEAVVDCDFGMSKRQVFQLADFDTRALPHEAHNAAKHCLIVLLGGRDRLVLRPDPFSRREWHAQPVIRARVYLPLRAPVAPPPVGYVESMPEVKGGPFLEVSAYMHWLSERGFDVALVRSMLNGRDTSG